MADDMPPRPYGAFAALPFDHVCWSCGNTVKGLAVQYTCKDCEVSWYKFGHQAKPRNYEDDPTRV